MSRIAPMAFQQRHVDALLARFEGLRFQYEQLGNNPDQTELSRLREYSACAMLQAPTGIGKTLMACELMDRFSVGERILWFWFAPFAGLIGQAEKALKRQAPNLPQLDIESDRRPEKLSPGAVFVLTWQTVAARSRQSRLARQSGDVGLAVDDLVRIARDHGYRLGVIVDEAHHGFVRAAEACRFFREVMAPDYVLLMTATPRDTDAARFAEATGYRLGEPSEWASVTRSEGVNAELLKRSVKAARFIAKNQDDAQLLSFEEVALSECAAMHRHIKETLKASQIGLTPLMLVQVPNGVAAMQKAKDYLTGTLRFSEQAVKVHTADEPDPNLAALADDPQTEIILFKMAIATGFDAPRAFTLAALRGARDVNFGIQVVGRIMRVHSLLQGRMKSLPPDLCYGYVFLANSEAQEGLLGAAGQINQMPQHLVSAVASTVITVVANETFVQYIRHGESLTLFPQEKAGSAPPGSSAAPGQETSSAIQGVLFAGSASQDPAHSLFTSGFAGKTRLTEALVLDAQAKARSYARKTTAPKEFVTESMPAIPEDFEARLVAHVDFVKVLADRLKVRSKVIERTTDVFDAQMPEDKDIWAQVSPRAIAEKARQIAFEFEDVDRRELLRALKERFREALISEGHEPPSTDEELTRQLELILVRNHRLIKEAYKRVRAEQIQARKIYLRDAIVTESDLEPAKRNIYGVFPEDLTSPEREFAEILDTANEIVWWHKNLVRKPDSVALYRWSDGIGFFPDFVVGVTERPEANGPALAEIKGPQLQHYDREKAGAEHIEYGRVFMIGKEGAEGGFRLWRLTGDNLVDDGPFEAKRLRYS